MISHFVYYHRTSGMAMFSVTTMKEIRFLIEEANASDLEFKHGFWYLKYASTYARTWKESWPEFYTSVEFWRKQKEMFVNGEAEEEKTGWTLSGVQDAGAKVLGVPKRA